MTWLKKSIWSIIPKKSPEHLQCRSSAPLTFMRVPHVPLLRHGQLRSSSQRSPLFPGGQTQRGECPRTQVPALQKPKQTSFWHFSPLYPAEQLHRALPPTRLHIPLLLHWRLSHSSHFSPLNLERSKLNLLQNLNWSLKEHFSIERKYTLESPN